MKASADDSYKRAARVIGAVKATALSVSLCIAFGSVASVANAKGAACESVFVTSSSANIVSPGQEIWVTRGSRRIFARVDGAVDAKETLVLLNGLDRDLSYWEPFIAALAPKYRIIRMDQWGQGRTLAANGLMFETRMRDLVKDVDAVIDVVGVSGPLYVVGHSFGGGVGMSMLRESRHLIRELFLLAPFVPRLEEEQPFVGEVLEVARASTEITGMPTFAYDFVFNTFMRPWMYMTHWMNELTPKTPLETESVVQLTVAVREADVLGAIKNPGAPVTIISAGMDSMIPRGSHDKLFQAVPKDYRGQHVLLRVGSHYIPERNRESLLAARFINSIISRDFVLASGAEGEANLETGRVEFPGQTIELGRGTPHFQTK